MKPATSSSLSDLDAKFRAVCELLGRGSAIRAACAEVGIGVDSIYDAMDADPSRAERYARARERQADSHADEIFDAAKRLTLGAISGDITNEQINAHRVSIDARKWAASKLRPKVYGDRLDIALESRAELLVLDYGRSAALITGLAPKAIEAEVIREIQAPKRAAPKRKAARKK